MKLWNQKSNLNELIEHFTVGSDPVIDLHLVKYDIQGTMAHVRMLEKINILSQEECSQIISELQKMAKESEENHFEIEEGVEDMHSQIEMNLTRTLGDVGKKVHTGRSRNDQVLTALHLFAKDSILKIFSLTEKVFTRLQERSEQHKDDRMPGYTHTQIAMPSSFGLWFGAYAEILVNDMEVFATAHTLADMNPLGSAAGYGTSLPLDRQMTTELMGFKTLHYNSIAAQNSRGKLELQCAFALSSLAHTLNKLASDLILFNSQNFAFVELPEELTTGSSIMPHKKNPDVFELLRAESNLLINLPGQISSVLSNLTMGYHRDYQIIKEKFVSSFLKMEQLLEIVHFAVGELKVNSDILSDSKYNVVFSVEEVNRKVMEGKTFRDAYFEVSEQVKTGQANFQSTKFKYTHLGSIDNLCNAQIKEKWECVKKKL